jgi:hypothetical protein
MALVVVESDAEVRRLRGRGTEAVTRRGLLADLRQRLVPGAVLASPVAVDLAVSGLLMQMAKTTPWLLQIVERGGRARADLVLAVVDALIEARRMLWFETLANGEDLASLRDPRGLVLAGAARELDRVLADAGLIDPSAESEVVTRALARASVDDVVDAIAARTVVATGIFSWLPADLVFWRALDAKLSTAGGSATIELVAFERPLDATRERDPLERLSDAIAEGLDSAPRTRVIAPVLGDLRFVHPAPEAVHTRVEVRRTDSAGSQASAIAHAVHARLAAGACVDDVAIVVPDGAVMASSDERGDDGRDARASIRRVLEEAGIPVHATLPDVPAAGGLLAFALEALAVADSGIPRLALATWLRASYFDASRITGLPEDQATASLQALARVLRSTPTVPGEDPASALAATVHASKGGGHGLSRLAVLAARVAGLLMRAREGRTRAEHAANAARLFQDIGLAARPGAATREHLAQDAPTRGVVRAELLSFARDTRDHAKLSAALGEYARTAGHLDAGSIPSTFEAFRFELEHALAREDPPGEARAAGAVRVSGWRDLPSRPLALLVVADAHERAFGAARRESPLLAGRLRARLMEGLDPALRASVLAAPAADLASLASAAHESARVLFVYRTRDTQGGTLAPHPLVDWLERQRAHVEVWRDKVTIDPPIHERERALAVAPWAARRAATEARREEAAGMPSPTAADERSSPSMSDPFRAILTEETGGADRAMSVTALDRFGSCRFQGFAAQVLRARVPEEHRDVVDAREEGTLLHGALAAAFRATSELWSVRPRDSETIRATAARAAAAFLALGRAASGLRRAALDAVHKDVSRVVEWSLADEEWDFAYAEAAFGQAESGWPEAILHDGRTTLRLRGSIDRVDVAHGRARLRVVDYKRSPHSARRFTDALGETSFQIAVYGRAASVALGLAAEEGLYLPTRRLRPVALSRGQVAAWSVAHEPVEGTLEGTPRFERRALHVVERARQGDVAPRPADAGVCENCDFDRACRKPRFVITALGADDPDASSREGSRDSG